jgi:hypothetical protein
MNTINATQIPEIDSWINTQGDAQVSECVAELLRRIYLWASVNSYEILLTTSFQHKHGRFDICILYV